MDTLHSVLFYAFAAVTVAGGLVTALLGGRPRALGVGAVAIGLAGLYADLNAGFAALVTLLALAAAAILLLRLEPAPSTPAGIAQQIGAVLAGAAFLVLAYVSFSFTYFSGDNLTGTFNAAALGRLLFGRDALATVAIAAGLLVAAASGGLLVRTRTR